MKEFLNALSIRHLSMAAAFILYAVFSSPTPDSYSFIELIISVLLIASIRFDPAHQSALSAIFLLYGLSVPVIASLTNGYDPTLILRDIIPFLFLTMPFFYQYRTKIDRVFLSVIASAVGVIFSLRSLSEFGPRLWNPSSWLGAPPDLLYLANSPEVLFSCVWLAGLTVYAISGFANRFCAASLGFVALWAMAAAMQRASLLYIALIATGALMWLMWNRPYRGIAVFLFALVVGTISWPVLNDIIAQLFFKTQMVGFNSRTDEFKAVLNQITTSPISFFFGLGWGAEIENPAVGGLRVSYTHSLFSALLLKSGVAGLALFVLYGLNLVVSSLSALNEKKYYFFALAGPLLIGFLLYASYKSIGYGLLLVILASFSSKAKKLEQGQTAVS